MRVCGQMLAPPAVLALAPLAVMLTAAGAPAVLADLPLAVMLADARAPAVLAVAPAAVMLADARAPQSLQVLLSRLCWQMLPPPQSLHLLLWRLCWQTPVPPQSCTEPVVPGARRCCRPRSPRPGSCIGHAGTSSVPRLRRPGPLLPAIRLLLSPLHCCSGRHCNGSAVVYCRSGPQ